MIKCPACSHENVDGTMFCEMCGEDMQAPGSAAPAGGASTPAAGTAEIKCPACENMNPADNVVCEICGTELRPADDDADIAPSIPAAPSTPAPTATVDTASTPVAPPASAPDLTAVVSPATAPATTPFDAALNDVAAAAATAAPDATAAAPSTPDVAIAPVPATPTVATPDAASTPAEPLLPGKVKLVVEQGMTIGKQFVLSDAEVQVGREDADDDIYPDIDLADQDEGYVHRKHATLKFENDQLMVTHLGGANKTRINNKPIPDNTPQPAKLGDKIAFGKVVLGLTAV